MFYLPTEIGERYMQAMLKRVCTLPNGDYISRSAGGRRNGRKTKYSAVIGGKRFNFTAASDNEAVEIANTKKG